MRRGVVPIDRVAAEEAVARANAEAERARRYAIKQEVGQKTLLMKRYQQKLREITEVNATMLSANGDLLLRREIQRLESEILELKKDLS